LLDMPDLLLYFQKIMAERGLTYKVGFTGRLRFFYMNRHSPLPDGKKTAPGHAQRFNLLQQDFGTFVNSALKARKQLGCAKDDILDAFAAL